MNIKKRDQWYMAMLPVIASASKDRSVKIGAIIVGPDDEPRSFGYNGIPRNLNDEVAARHQRPEKYKWFEHAERNAIYNAARVGISLKGCTIYVTCMPCNDCMRGIIQVGITRVVFGPPPNTDSGSITHHREEYERSLEMMKEAGILFTAFIN